MRWRGEQPKRLLSICLQSVGASSMSRRCLHLWRRSGIPARDLGGLRPPLGAVSPRIDNH